jgi:alpha-ribazole phosphatase
MSDSTVLWLVRHPEPEESARGRCYGTLDVGLSPEGLRDAEVLAEALAEEPFAAVYTSPRTRCTYPAGKIASKCGCPLEVVEGLRELDFGDFEGRTYDEVATLHPELYAQWMERPTELEFPGGESFAQMRTRVLATSAELRRRHAGQSILCVTHAGVIRTVVAEVLGLPAANMFRLAQDYGGLNIVRYHTGSASLELLNHTCSRRGKGAMLGYLPDTLS